MATLARQPMLNTGLVPSLASAGGSGDKALPGDNVFLVVANANGSSIDVVLVTPGTVDALAVADRTIAVADGAQAFIPLDPALYANRGDGGLAAWTYSANSGVTVGVVQR